MGTTEDFEIWTDHQNLQYFRKPQKVNRRQARWISELGKYNFTLHHKPRKVNIKPDILSRRPDLKWGEKYNENITMLKEHHFRTQEFIFESLDDNFLRRVCASRKSRDRMVEKALCQIPGFCRVTGVT